MTDRQRWRRSTIRVRLTLLYAGAFFLVGAVLVGVMYLYLEQVLGHQLSVRPSPGAHDPLHDVLTAQLQRARDDTLTTMFIASIAALCAVGVVATGLGWLLAGRTLSPLQRITGTARRVADRSLHERIALDGPDDEIKDLADTFDAMLERLDRSFDSQRRFVANASHELRTPLTINRTLIEVALGDPHVHGSLRRLGATLLAVNERHERLIDGLLTLVSSEQTTESSAVDLGDVARHVTAESQSAARNAGVDLRSDLRPAPTSGDPVLLERLAQNLIDNAVRYNLPEQGWVMVSTGLGDNDVHLTIENSGPPIPAHEVPRLFEPFRRLPSTERLADSRTTSISRGAGLGLSIARSIVHAHGGVIHASSRKGGGLTVRLRLPKVRARSVGKSA